MMYILRDFNVYMDSIFFSSSRALGEGSDVVEETFE